MAVFQSNSIIKILTPLKIIVNLKFWIIFVTILLGPFWLANLAGFVSVPTMAILQKNQVKTIMVLGAQASNDLPSQILARRLDKAYEIFQGGQFDKILLSGGQREPFAMSNYLQEMGIPRESLFEDWGGLRTIDSCWRAKNIFKIQKLVIITQNFHLPRAISICQSLGLEVWPVAAANSTFGTVTYGIYREIFACWDSLIDLLKDYKPPIQSDGLEPNLSD